MEGKMQKKKLRLLTILILTTFLTGCWDYIDIDKRGFAAAIGIDRFEYKPLEGTKRGAMIPEDIPQNRLSITYSIPNASFIVGESETPNIIYNTVGETFYGSSTNLATRYDKQLNFGHLKVVVLSEEVMREEHLFREILDALERDPFINRRLYMLMTSDTAKEVLEVEPQSNPITGKFLADLLKNKGRPARSGSGIMADIYKDLHWRGNTLIPRIIPGVEDIKVAGYGVIKNFEFQGWLGEIDTRSMEIIQGSARPEGIKFRHPAKDHASGEKGDHDYHVIPVELAYLSSKFHLIGKDKNAIKVVIEIKTEGTVEEFYFEPKESLLDPKIIKDFDKEICKKLKNELYGTVEKLQKDFKVDVLGIDNYLSKHHPKLWREVEDDWDEIFPTIDIVIDTSTNIRQIGVLE